MQRLTFEASQVLFSLQYLHSLSHCGHITILPPMSGSHTSLLRDGRQENGVRLCFYPSIGASVDAERRV